MREMSVPLRLAAFAAVVAVALFGAFGIGSAVGPVGSTPTEESHGHDQPASAHGAPAVEPPAGLQSSASGYTLHLVTPTFEPGRQPVRFRILDAEGQPVTDYTTVHEAQLHFFAVRRDLSGFAHLHPTMDALGTWSIDVDLTPGTWRFLADFQPDGADEPLTLGRDAHVTGKFAPTQLPAASRTAMVEDYQVALAGDLVPGQGTELTLSVTRDGRPVTDLDPYLGAYGHLVVLREGDLAYLHVHPEGEPGDATTKPGPDISFHTTAPSAGSYRFFLDFKHEGVVRTVAFTVPVGGNAQSVNNVQPEGGRHHEDEHSHD